MGRKQAEYNIHNYVQDSTEGFDTKPFNEIDGLIMTQISNMDLSESGIDLYSNNNKSFEEIYREMTIEGTPANDAYNSMSADNRKLIKELAQSDRYKNMVVSNYVNNPVTGGDEVIPGFESVGEDAYMEQFAAVTITYKQNGETYNYVSYQATNNTTDGWTEDFAMLSRTSTQAQADSAAYMNIIGKSTDGYIVGGGHSKGGNDFEYAYLFCDDDVRQRIIKGYVYDSPGLESGIVEGNPYFSDYQNIIDGTFICPQDSIIGMLLHENENPSFVHSVESGFNEHDPYSWEIDPNTGGFVPDEQTELSKQINKALDRAVEGMSQEERDALFAFIEYVMYNNGGESLDGLGNLFAEGWDDPKKKIDEIWTVLSGAWNNMSEEEREEFVDSLGVVIAAIASTAYEYGKEELEKWLEKKKEEIEQKFNEAWQAAADWIKEKKEGFKKFLSNVYKSVVTGFNKVAGWIRSFSYGSRYASSNPHIKVDTFKLREYASRIYAINRRISNLDGRLDSLYWRVGLLDLWNLMQADIMTGYSWRLSRAASYLNDTASDFDAIETELANGL